MLRFQHFVCESVDFSMIGKSFVQTFQSGLVKARVYKVGNSSLWFNYSHLLNQIELVQQSWNHGHPKLFVSYTIQIVYSSPSASVRVCVLRNSRHTLNTRRCNSKYRIVLQNSNVDNYFCRNYHRLIFVKIFLYIIICVINTFFFINLYKF